MTRAVEQRGAAGGRDGAGGGGMGGSRGRSYLADPSPNLPGVSAEKFSRISPARWALGVVVDGACAVAAASIIAGLCAWGWAKETFGRGRRA
jgi:hypothetical protein